MASKNWLSLLASIVNPFIYTPSSFTSLFYRNFFFPLNNALIKGTEQKYLLGKNTLCDCRYFYILVLFLNISVNLFLDIFVIGDIFVLFRKDNNFFLSNLIPDLFINFKLLRLNLV